MLTSSYKKKVLKEMNSSPLVGYLGVYKTFTKVRERASIGKECGRMYMHL